MADTSTLNRTRPALSLPTLSFSHEVRTVASIHGGLLTYVTYMGDIDWARASLTGSHEGCTRDAIVYPSFSSGEELALRIASGQSVEIWSDDDDDGGLRYKMIGRDGDSLGGGYTDGFIRVVEA